MTIVRLFNTVGPRQVGRYGMVLPRFVQSALRNEPLKVHGDGNQTRCFCHVSDVVDAIVGLMNKPASAGRVFNVGSEQEVSINDLARSVIALCKSRSQIEYLSYEQAYGQQFEDMARRVPDLSRIRSVMPFVPRMPLNDIIESVIAAHRAG